MCFWRSLTFLLSLHRIVYPVYGQAPPQPENIGINGTTFLDHESPINSFYGQTFLRENIPYIDIPDNNIQDVYYYRWSSLARHLHYAVPGTGYVLTEFVQPVGYSMAFDTIDAAAGHQIDEARWLRSDYFTNDYVQFWTRGPGNSTQYTHWILDAAYRKSQVDGNVQFLINQLPGMIDMWNQWYFAFDFGVGLYHFSPTDDAQEFSLPGWVASDGGLTNITLLNVGPDTYRPSHNAYMVGNARAIAQTAAAAGNVTVAANFTSIADNLESAIFKYLWDPTQQFFVDVIRSNNSNLTQLQGREEVGLFPFRFGIGLQKQYSDPSAQEVFDIQGFGSEFGPTTLETRNYYYDAIKPATYCCYWNGQSWPFSTAHVLKSLAAIYRTGNSSLTADDYYQVLSTYATTQHDYDGRPFVAEAHYPELNAWSAYTANHSEHYDHSTNNDDVITGLLGLIPRSDNMLQISPIIPQNWTYFALEDVAYHGHLLTILYDLDGTRYNQSKGLTVYVDGQNYYNSPNPPALFALPDAITPSTTPIPVNIAVNSKGNDYFPNASATTTYGLDSPFKANDGFIFYDYIPDNRWTNNQSYFFNDTYELFFARPQTFSSITLAIYSDKARGGMVDCPASLEIYGDTGVYATLANFTAICLPNDRNTIFFGQNVTTSFIAVNMYIQRSFAVGLAELEIWVPPSRGPTYYAVDHFLINTIIEFDKSTKTATVTGAVVGNNTETGSIVFSGVYSDAGGPVTLDVSYTNRATEASMMQILINRVPTARGNLTLAPTGNAYRTISVDGELLAGNNFVTISGGNGYVYYDTLTVNALTQTTRC